MRTRTSNRTKRYTVEKYDFDSSSDEAVPAPQRRKNADERDANFDGALEDDDDDDDHVGAEEDEDEDHDDGRQDDDSDAEVPGARRLPRQRVAPIKPFTAHATSAHSTAAYRNIEPLPADSHAVKSYVGPYDRSMRRQPLIEVWYGPRRERLQTTERLLERWIGWPVLPPKLVAGVGGLAEGCVWSPGFFEREAGLVGGWRERVREASSGGARCRALTAEEAKPYRPPSRLLPVLMGPYPTQREIQFKLGDAHPLSQSGIPYDQDENEAKTPAGWILDAGGLVLGMDWATRRGEDATQLLALAVVPHADQENYDYEAEHQKPDFERHGTVQLWGFRGEKTHVGIVRPSTQQPKLQRTLCLDCGRARRVRWSPACDFLAIICGDGGIRVVDVDGEAYGAYEKVQEPVASLILSDEEGVKATAMAWSSLNRLAVGYSDGSVALWSIYPTRLLSRHPVHHSDVIDIATGYPSMPYLVASTPIGGSAKLVDFRAPSYETTEVQINSVSWQPNLLAWSDHILGFFSGYPSANALNTMVGFMHHRHFPLVRRIFTSECFLSCLAVGRTHPYLLIGTTDGSLWCLNPQCELFRPRRPPADRIRILQHEHRPAEFFPQESPASARGASRLIHGFGTETNRHFMAEARAPPRKGKGRRKNDNADDDGGDDEPAALMDPRRAIVHEFLTRVTAVEWNPNEGYGCWAAAALGSGLVRVLDLGIENVPDEAEGEEEEE
ncbi:Uncharacterized protein TCAP_06894 [Tolypocladium capitatum]|uniref:Anaphase-promoting complex subunit 4-like WD40 domain-containing protein n=1 Tax=Tolypocladium capitatum TaxID=45235 RepID=A0A2K3Q6K2_9HYPO|nr:Uncharacterized protein TCAP_06894 [Tolypocladium capitatum]